MTDRTTVDDVTGHGFSMVLYREALRRAAIADAQATADTMAAIIARYIY